MKPRSTAGCAGAVCLFCVMGCTLDETVARDDGENAGGGAHVAAPGAVLRCDSDPPPLAPPAGDCRTDGFCWENPLGSGDRARFASPPGVEPWLVRSGELKRRSGETWVPVEVPLDTLVDAAVVSPTSIWAVGKLGEDSAAVYFDGDSWSTHRIAPEWQLQLLAVRAVANAAWAVAFDSEHHYFVSFDGERWAEVPGYESGSLLFVDIVDYGAVSADEAWVVEGETAWQFSDGSWHERTPPELALFGSVAAFGPDDVWVGGASEEQIDATAHDPEINLPTRSAGALAHWDGSEFRLVSLPAVGKVSAITRASDGGLWLGTVDGELLRYDGQRAELEQGFTATRSIQGFATHGNEVWASLNEDQIAGLLHYDGRSWSDPSPLATVEAFRGVWGAADDDVWAVGTRGHKAHFDGRSWALHVSGTESASGIWGTASDNVWVVGEEGLIEHYDGRAWTERARVEDSLSAVWGTAPDSLWIHGQYGVHHYKGGALRSLPDSPGVSFFGMMTQSIWASSDDDVWVAAGKLYHFDGHDWNVAFDQGTGHFETVWGRGPGDVFVAGFEGLFHGVQGTFTRIEGADGESVQFAHQMGGCDGHVWITDHFGLYFLQGSALTRAPGTWPSLRGVWGTSPDRLVAVGARGSILRRQP